MRIIQQLLADARQSQSAMARAVGISPATMTEILLHNRWPKRRSREELRTGMVRFLADAGADLAAINEAFLEIESDTETQAKEETKPMLIRCQALLPSTRKHFKLMTDPFHNELRSPDDVFLSGDIRMVREAIWFHSEGMMAIVGESGSGKTTLVRDFKARVAKSDRPVHIIEPYVLAMEDNDKKGKTLKSQHIVEAVMATIAPLERPVSSPEARFRQMHGILRDSARAGFRHVLIIEEAHSLPVATLKQLKRFLDLDTKDGFGKLLSVLLIGQPELMERLSASNYAVREVTQRCEIVTLRALDNDLDGYLRFKFERAGADVTQIITEDGIEALRSRLTGNALKGAHSRISLCYPLVVGNVMAAAMNLAADVGAPLVDPGIIAQV
ncbi:AAA family ATPase [Pseudodesulfovibrio pelocollis]|uniref:AAA family ATPase n=1 Tax=Pseudodesulfovibrio pelocollis TaxID=3051432 RepID=UPI00255A9196|nr:AAA family ATPase [Pseudodesulfovibrio sp. SB368]